MKRRLLHILLTLSLLVSLLSLAAWPISCYHSVSLFRAGSSTLQHWSLGGGGVAWMHQGGPGTAELIRSAPIRPGTVELHSARDRTHYFDFNEYWRQSMRFNYMSRATTLPVTAALVRQRHIVIPLWFTAWLFAMPPAIALQRYRVRRRRIRAGLCLGCGYDLRASTDRCPECGLAR